MVHLTTSPNPSHARIVAARLGSDGVLTELQGGSDTFHPVGGDVRVLVHEDDFELAREILLVEEVESALETAWHGEAEACPRCARRRRRTRWVAGGLVVGFAAVRLIELFVS